MRKEENVNRRMRRKDAEGKTIVILRSEPVHNCFIKEEVSVSKDEPLREPLMRKDMGNMYRWKPLEASLRKALRDKHGWPRIKKEERSVFIFRYNLTVLTTIIIKYIFNNYELFKFQLGF
jgi:hypothetical protein